jgi:hypothetical protein
MAKPASLAHSIEQPLLKDDCLADDRLDFDAWLLPCETPNRRERAVRLFSTASGPVIGTIALACVIAWII